MCWESRIGDVEVGLVRGELGEHGVVPVRVRHGVDLDGDVRPLLGVLRVREVLQRLGRRPLEPDEAEGQRVLGELGMVAGALGPLALAPSPWPPSPPPPPPPCVATSSTAAVGQLHLPTGKGQSSYSLREPHLLSCFLDRGLVPGSSLGTVLRMTAAGLVAGDEDGSPTRLLARRTSMLRDPPVLARGRAALSSAVRGVAEGSSLFLYDPMSATAWRSGAADVNRFARMQDDALTTRMDGEAMTERGAQPGDERAAAVGRGPAGGWPTRCTTRCSGS